jgi:hypothetical protein
MIPLFMGYALTVWLLAARHRRQLLGWAAVLGGVGALVAVAMVHYLVGRAHPEIFMQGMQVLLYPYTAMVAGVGFFVVSMPRGHDGLRCRRCRYDLAGLHDDEIDRCPECGEPLPERPRAAAHRPSGLERTDLQHSDGPDSWRGHTGPPRPRTPWPEARVIHWGPTVTTSEPAASGSGTPEPRG